MEVVDHGKFSAVSGGKGLLDELVLNVKEEVMRFFQRDLPELSVNEEELSQEGLDEEELSQEEMV